MKINEIIEDSEQPELVVCVGLPGGGKSYQIKRRYPNHVVVSSDNIIERLSAQDGMTYDQGFQKFIGRATKEMWGEFKGALRNNENIVWDQTNLSVKKRKSILSQVPKHYKTVALVVEVDENLRKERTGQREGKTIPDHVIESMRKSYQPPTKEEGFDEIIVVKE